MLVDPRPFTYEYRKPRIFNPTYQSRNLYESLYHRYPQQSNDYFPPKIAMRYDSIDRLQRNINQEPKELNRNRSQTKQIVGNNYTRQQNIPKTDRNPQKYEAGYKLPSIAKGNQRTRVQSNLGANMQQINSQPQGSIQRRKGFQRFRIYQRQQKPFNIISCYPKEDQSNRLRNFPKLTLQDKLIERGSYHTFREQKF